MAPWTTQLQLLNSAIVEQKKPQKQWKNWQKMLEFKKINFLGTLESNLKKRQRNSLQLGKCFVKRKPAGIC